MKTLGRYIFIAVLIAVFCVETGGQVRRIQQGHAIDANPRKGSGGINYPVPRNYAPINTHISGITRSRGLSSFQGRAPSLDNQLSVRIRTDGITTFRQQSVGIMDVLRGGTYRPQDQIYDDPLRTTIHPRDIVRAESRRQVPLPGRVSRISLNLAKDLYVDATAGYKPLMPHDSRLTRGNALDLLPTRINTKADLRLVRQAESLDVADRGGDELFGVLRRKDRARLARELSKYDKEDEEDTRIDHAIRTEVDTQIGEPIDAELGKDLPRRLEGPDSQKEELSVDQREARPILEMPRSVLPEENADVFLDLLVRLREQKMGQEWIDGEKDDEEMSLQPQLLHQPFGLPSKQKNVELTRDNKIVIRRLAGTGEDIYNRYMQQAEKAFKKGRYYGAAQQYDKAILVRPKSPLSRLGGCFANFACQQWYTSGQYLQTALELFPPLMKTAPDMHHLLPIREIDSRLKSLEKWVAKINDKPTLIFLAAFMQYNYGEKDLAEKHAETILKTPRIPRIFRAYAEYVLTGDLPADAKPKPKPTQNPSK